MAATSWSSWQVSSIVGILLASFFPDNWGLELAGTLALIPLIVSAITTRSTLAAVGVTSVIALIIDLPYRLSLPLAVAAALPAGTFADLMAEKMGSGQTISAARRSETPVARLADVEPLKNPLSDPRQIAGQPQGHSERPMSAAQVWLAIAGMALITGITRPLFLMGGERMILPERVRRAQRLPDLLTTPNGLSSAFSNHALYASLCGLAWFLWRRGMLGTIVVSMMVFTALRLFA
ncbi:MAG: Branched-chain amino acid transport protein AzlC [uncultured Caballeronia sp.]|nr:MAG: Branched-chain amino acid transport protein AzlC [uncultured Caballeronia sp.]